MSKKRTFTRRMCINGELWFNFSQINFRQIKIFHNEPRNLPKKILVPSEVIDPRQIKNFDLSHFSLAFFEFLLNKKEFEKNVVEYNLFAVKLSSKKILDQFFSCFPLWRKLQLIGKIWT